MARCGCAGGVCTCVIRGEEDLPCIDVVVSGNGTAEVPYQISASPIFDQTAGNLLSCEGTGLRADLSTTDSATVDFSGLGTPASPLTAVVIPAAVDHIAPFFRTGTLIVTSGVARWKFPFAVTLVSVTAAVSTAPTGAAIILDVNLNGTTIFTNQANRPTIAIGAFQETTDAVPDVTAVAADQYLTVDIDQIGSTIAGAELTVFVRYSS